MKISIAIFLIVLFVGCQQTDNTISPDKIQTIRYGTSFGECIGYCLNSIEITEGKIEINKTGWDMNGMLPEQKYSETMYNFYWQSLVEMIDFNTLCQLDTLIGCPDCADGGAEWVEVEQDNQRVKIVFEYMNEPQAMSEYIRKLRTYMMSMNMQSTDATNFNERTLIKQEGTIKNFICSRGCFQYLIEIHHNSSVIYYFDPYLDATYQTDGLEIQFSGVLQNDSTTINKPAANDVPVPDFKARNIQITEIKIKGH